jgi:uncharacterized protein (DUF433 family)
MDIKETVIVRSQDVLGGTPVFCGTRVPFQTLIGYAVAALEQAKDLVLARV